MQFHLHEAVLIKECSSALRDLRERFNFFTVKIFVRSFLESNTTFPPFRDTLAPSEIRRDNIWEVDTQAMELRYLRTRPYAVSRFPHRKQEESF